ncbi:four-helix bundle copper-binding protein [Streptomyces synnematoformans]|uniref:Four-helix bundle copper-binding protein n=1 Tax=Streptomyces synnematoformans TaxID=415721 RepID=A0ABN2Z8N4_9ACTN
MTTYVTEMLRTHPLPAGTPDEETLNRGIRECLDCAQACTMCGDACLAEKSVGDLGVCIRLDQDCADVCETTARVLSRRTGYDPELARQLLQACATACKACGDECDRHAAGHDHCRLCAAACRSCEEVCTDLIASFG